MDHEVKPWNDGIFPWSNFLKKQFTKPLFSLLGVNRMWTKRNDHAPKTSCAGFLNICPKEEVLKKIQVQPFSCLLMPSLVFTSKKNKKSHKYIIPILFCHELLIFFFLLEHLFSSPTGKPVGSCQRIM